MPSAVATGLSVMRFLQRHHIIPGMSINITPFLNNMPVTLTIDANHMGIVAETNGNHLKTTFEHQTGTINMSAVVHVSNFGLEAEFECTPKQDAMPGAVETTRDVMPQSCVLQTLQQCFLRNFMAKQELLLEAYSCRNHSSKYIWFGLQFRI